MQGIGVLLIIWGFLDYVLGESGTDVYYDWFGIYIPDGLYTYTPWISIAMGGLLIGAGRKNQKQ